MLQLGLVGKIEDDSALKIEALKSISWFFTPRGSSAVKGSLLTSLPRPVKNGNFRVSEWPRPIVEYIFFAMTSKILG